MSSSLEMPPGGHSLAAERRTCVLNVNDSAPGREVVSRMLRRAGFEPIEAGTGAEALRLATSRMPQVAIIDVPLSDLDGREVCRRLRTREATSSIALIQTSPSLAGPADRVQVLSSADAFLSQPFQAEELLATVHAILRLRGAEQSARREALRIAELDRRKTDFIAMLGHELRNPLAAISMADQLLRRLPARDASEQRSRDVIQRQTRALTRLVDDLLDLSRIERGKIELRRSRLDLGQVVAEAVQALQPTAHQRGVRLDATLPGEPLIVSGDAVRLEQIFANLVGNSLKFTEAGGGVLVKLGVKHGPPAPSAILRVEDSGAGMDQTTLQRIFEPFEQGANAVGHGGLGIGLALARVLVSLHGGAIAAHSDGPGRGSAFEVQLPLAG